MALCLCLLFVAYLLVIAEEQDLLTRTLQSTGTEAARVVKTDTSPVDSASSRLGSRLAGRMWKQELVTALGVSQEIAALNYDLRWGNEWFLLNDVKRPGTNIYVFGAFWDVRARLFNLRYGYWIQDYAMYLNFTAEQEAERRKKMNQTVITSTTTKLNINPQNQTLIAEMKRMFFDLHAQGYSRDDIGDMLKGNFSAALEQDRMQRLAEKEKLLQLQNERNNRTPPEEAGTGESSSPPPTSPPTDKLWDPESDRLKNKGGSTLTIEEAKNLEGLTDIQLKKIFRREKMHKRKRNAMKNVQPEFDGGSGSDISSGQARKLQNKPLPASAKTKINKLPTGIGDALYVRVYLVAHKKLIGPGTMRPGLVDYRVGTCEFHYRSGKITEGKYYLQVQSRELNKQGKMLAGAYAICHLDGFTGDEYPEGVALRPLNYKGEKQIMMIRGNRKVVQHLGTRHARQKKFLAVCVRPIFKAYQDYQQMANFLVYYSHVGVNHFVIYNSGVASPRLMGLLDIARRANVSLELRNWNIQDNLAYENMQNMNIEVCVHSLMGFYKYVAVVDLDELIVPMKVSYLPTLIQSLTKNTPRMIDKPHAMIFKTAFFCKTNSPRITYPGYRNNGDKLMILRDVIRTDVVQTVRYKYIVRPESLYESGVHFPLLSPRVIMRQLTEPIMYVSEKDALVHHYRDIELDMHDIKEAKNCSIMDSTMFRYAHDLKNSHLYKLLANEGYWQPASRQTKIQESTRENFDASSHGAGNIIAAYDKKQYYEKMYRKRNEAKKSQAAG